MWGGPVGPLEKSFKDPAGMSGQNRGMYFA